MAWKIPVNEEYIVFILDTMVDDCDSQAVLWINKGAWGYGEILNVSYLKSIVFNFENGDIWLDPGLLNSCA
jgi:hypothetical protein